jgi:twinkle protein
MNVLHGDDIDFKKYEQETEARQRVRPAKAYVRELTDQLGKPILAPGDPLPWEKSRKLFRFRPGEVTLWAGVNGHGKSLMSGFVSLALMALGRRVCIASFEMKPHSTLRRMIRQWCGYSAEDEFAMHPEMVSCLRDLHEQFEVLADKRLWFYDQQGSVKAEQMIAVARYCAKELRIQHLFIDSLMKCVRGADDWSAQKDFVNELCTIAVDYGIHIHLVHHIRKLDNELRKPDKMDVKGAGEIADMVDNMLLVWRNKAEAGHRKTADPDAALICCKQRHGEWESGMNLWFDRASQQFVGEQGAPIINFAEFH